MKSNLGILSLGCPRNLVDSESILGRLSGKGYSITDIDKAEVALLNTCCFIEDARRESIEAIMDLIELKKEGRLKKIIVYGCLTQRYKDTLIKELPEIDAFVGRLSFPFKNGSTFNLTPKHYTYLKICEGCVNNCSFCVIPKIKGRFTSLDMDSILNKVEALNKEKLAELNLIGQDITGYGIDLYGRPKLDELLKRIIKTSKDISWIRLLYLYPNRLSDELLELIKNEPKVCPYIDLPIQHINNRILKLMNRETDKSAILRLIDKIRKTIPGVALRTSVIVGFPSETDREFKELLRFIEEAKFERLGAFIYSREEDTPAYNFERQVPEKIKRERFNNLMSSQQRISEETNKKLLNKTIDVLLDEKEEDYYLGRSQYDAPEVDGQVYVNFPNGLNSRRELKVGDFVKVKITDTLEYDLIGEVVE